MGVGDLQTPTVRRAGAQHKRQGVADGEFLTPTVMRAAAQHKRQGVADGEILSPTVMSASKKNKDQVILSYDLDRAVTNKQEYSYDLSLIHI